MSSSRPGKKNETIILHASDSISWASCISISRNLREAYIGALPDPLFLPYTNSDDVPGNFRIANLIKSHSPRSVIFLDHIPHPIGSLHALRSVFGSKKMPELSFHVYGDFSLCSRAWLGVEKLLGPNAQARFICASEKQLAHVSQFFQDGSVGKNLELLPFPIATKKFKYLAKARSGVRKELGIPNDAFVFLFAGRISLQKNIMLMIEAFQAIAAKNKKVHLLLLGSEDDIGAPMHGIGCELGSYGLAISDCLQRLPGGIRKRIHSVGTVGSEQLAAFYSAADVYFSLSLHHDEDYGMAPAEALCCGLPTCLTDWGGFSAHPEVAEDGILIPVSNALEGLTINKSALRLKMLRCLEYRSDNETRYRRSEHYRSRYSIDRCATLIRELSARPAAKFAGFNSQMTELAFLNAVHDGSPFRDNDLATRQFYKRTYAKYFEKTELR